MFVAFRWQELCSEMQPFLFRCGVDGRIEQGKNRGRAEGGRVNATVGGCISAFQM